MHEYAWNFDVLINEVLSILFTNGSPSPALAHERGFRYCFNCSATGDIRCGGGNIGAEHA